MSGITTVAIVDADLKMRKAIAAVISVEGEVRVICSLRSGEAALTQLPAAKPDIVLMAINMEGIGGIEATRRLKRSLPEMKVIMLAASEDFASVSAALAAGADGYLLKRLAPDHLSGAIREVLEGGAPLSAPIARKVVASFRRDHEGSDALPLSPREREVLDGLARGLLYKGIAAELGVSMSTIRTYIVRIYQKLQVHSRTEAVVRYLERR